MAAVTGIKVVATEFSGRKKIAYITGTITTASDAMTLTQATHGFSTIDVAIPIITGGFDTLFSNVVASVSGLVITLTSVGTGGTAATDFTNTTIGLLVIGDT